MPVTATTEAPPNILKAISAAARKTGTDFQYLLSTAARESSYNPSAKASGSSATGLFQFIESTWLETVKEEGARFGLAQHAAKITKSVDGSYSVANDEARAQIMALRKDAKIASLMAAAYTQKNADTLESKIGRTPSQGELYLAHFMGPTNALKLIDLQQSNPNISADKAFPSAAKANPAIFASSKGSRTAKEVYNLLMGSDTGRKYSENTPTELARKPVPKTAKSVEPLVQIKPIKPFQNLYGNGAVQLGSSDNLWGDLLTAPKKQKPAPTPPGPQTQLTPSAAPNEGQKLSKIEWVNLSASTGSQKNFKA